MKHLLLAALLLPLDALAADYVVTIKDHKFQPAEITVIGILR